MAVGNKSEIMRNFNFSGVVALTVGFALILLFSWMLFSGKIGLAAFVSLFSVLSLVPSMLGYIWIPPGLLPKN